MSNTLAAVISFSREILSNIPLTFTEVVSILVDLIRLGLAIGAYRKERTKTSAKKGRRR